MNKKARKPLTIAIISAVAVGAVFGGVRLYKSRSTSEVEVYPVYNLSTQYWGDSSTYSGYIVSGKTQIVTMKQGLVESVNVSEGDEVKEGDVLMVYNTDSLKLTLQSDEARIAVLESNLDIAQKQLNTYRYLRPSEEMPQVQEVVTDNGPLVLDESPITAKAFKSGEMTFKCDADTVVTADFLKLLRENPDSTAVFEMYEISGDASSADPSSSDYRAVMYARYTVSGSDSSLQIYTEEFETEVTLPAGEDEPETKEPETETEEPATETEEPATETEEPVTETEEPATETEETESETETGSIVPGGSSFSGFFAAGHGSGTRLILADKTVTGTVTIKRDVDPITDWRLGNGLEFTGDGVHISAGRDTVSFGEFESFTPVPYERFTTEYKGGYQPDGTENYMYSRADLAEMVKQQEKTVRDLGFELKEAELTYKQDQLVSESGEVKASISGTVTDLKDPAGVSAGESVMTVKGAGSYEVTFYISESKIPEIAEGDPISLIAYESGNFMTGTITEIDTSSPAEGTYWFGAENPNANSAYLATAELEDTGAELRIGEWCEITLDSGSGSSGNAWYLNKMFIRSDDSGSYVMKKDDSGKLVRQYIKTGKLIWSSYYEIKSGLTQEDWIAFPYGKTVTEGARVIEKDYPEY
ncbi:MAG: HlyD family efflux transporter periplasmic adaptor subunit [Lachnospiraceae bacterium]|nr:HlyD family efflux transporter periplasmic adaptor subunit [Lachnospiraceae bacterium]